MTKEAFSRVKINAQLKEQGWGITNTNAVRPQQVGQQQAEAFA